jgi:hypothetical protein
MPLLFHCLGGKKGSIMTNKSLALGNIQNAIALLGREMKSLINTHEIDGEPVVVLAAEINSLSDVVRRLSCSGKG